MSGSLSLRKLHGAGNDFLVLVDLDESQPVGPAWARALCDRHRGAGADGLLVVLPPRSDGDVRMELLNADGSAAETSGNGLRCLVLAALDAGVVSGPGVRVETAAGTRTVEVRATTADGADIAVDMGTTRIAAADETPAPRSGWRARRADVGNPHLVLGVAAPGEHRGDDAEVAELGRRLDAAEAGGLNVEVVGPGPWGVLSMAVWERGAGLTLACGSGSCAAAAVARAWGLCGDTVTVRNPGGDLRVELSGPEPLAPRAVLSGPTTRVATIDVTMVLPLLEGASLRKAAT